MTFGVLSTPEAPASVFPEPFSPRFQKEFFDGISSAFFAFASLGVFGVFAALVTAFTITSPLAFAKRVFFPVFGSTL